MLVGIINNYTLIQRVGLWSLVPIYCKVSMYNSQYSASNISTWPLYWHLKTTLAIDSEDFLFHSSFSPTCSAIALLSVWSHLILTGLWKSSSCPAPCTSLSSLEQCSAERLCSCGHLPDSTGFLHSAHFPAATAFALLGDRMLLQVLSFPCPLQILTGWAHGYSFCWE